MNKTVVYLSLGVVVLVGLGVFARARSEANRSKAEALYAKVKAIQQNAKTVSFTITSYSKSGKPDSAVLMYKKPNLYRVEKPNTIRIGDGDTDCKLNFKKRVYETRSIEATRPSPNDYLCGFQHFTGAKMKGTEYPPELSTYKGTPTVKVQIVTLYGNNKEIADTQYSAKSLRPVAVLFTYVRPKEDNIKITVDYSNVVFDKDLPDSLFNTHPGSPYKAKQRDVSPLKVGSVAPSFAGRTIDSKPYDFKQHWSSHKAVLVYFCCFTWGRTGTELPHLEKFYQRFEAKGLDILAVGSKATFGRNKLSFPCVSKTEGKEKLDKLFEVTETPCLFIIDSKGIIRAVFEDYYPTKIEKELEKLGFSG